MKGLPTGLLTSTDFPEGLQSCWRGSFVRRRKQLGERGRLLGLIASLSSRAQLAELCGIWDSQSYLTWVLFVPLSCIKPAGRSTQPMFADSEAYGKCIHRFGSPKETSRWNQLLTDFKNNNITWDKYKLMNVGDTHISLPGFLHPHVLSQ